MSVITTEVISSDSKVDLEPCPKRGSDKIYSLRTRRKNTRENKSYRTAWTHKWEPNTKIADLSETQNKPGALSKSDLSK